MFGFSDKQDGDRRARKALDELGLKYNVDSSGKFKFIFELDGGRSQMGFITSETQEFAGIEMRELFSVGLKSSGEFPAAIANMLLKENEKVKIGAWEIIENSNGDNFALFNAKIAAEVPAKVLAPVILGVLKVADKMEERLTNEDNF